MVDWVCLAGGWWRAPLARRARFKQRPRSLALSVEVFEAVSLPASCVLSFSGSGASARARGVAAMREGHDRRRAGGDGGSDLGGEAEGATASQGRQSGGRGARGERAADGAVVEDGEFHFHSGNSRSRAPRGTCTTIVHTARATFRGSDLHYQFS